MRVDLRLLQIAFLACFLSYGITQLTWDIRLEQVFILMVSAVITQSLFCLAFNIPINAVKSALITSLGLSIILRSHYDFVFALAGCFSIGAKYIFRYNNKHFINPANFGVVFILLFTGVAWISQDQWNRSTILFFVIGSLGLIILTKLKKIDLSLSFVLFYFGLNFAWNILYKGLPLDFFLHSISNGSIVFFAFFLIADPSSTPNSRPARIVWVFFISVLAFYLATFHGVEGAALYSLFILSPLVPILDYLCKESVFAWDSMERNTLYTNSKL